jgi:hypothetical protein
MSSRICFVHPYRPSLSRVFYVTLTAEQAESMQKVGRADASARYPFFALKEQKEHGSEKADVEEGAATEDGVAFVAIEISMRGLHFVASLASMRHDEPLSTSWFFVQTID